MSKSKRGKRKKGRGPRPPKPPHKKAAPKQKRGELLRPFGVEAELQAELAAWRAQQDAGEAEDWSLPPDYDPQEIPEGFDMEGALKDWDELEALEAELANLLGEFLEAHPEAGTIDQAQHLFEAVILSNLLEPERVRPWAAGIVHWLSFLNGAMEHVTPELICRELQVELGQSELWAANLQAAVRKEGLG